MLYVDLDRSKEDRNRSAALIDHKYPVQVLNEALNPGMDFQLDRAILRIMFGLDPMTIVALRCCCCRNISAAMVFGLAGRTVKISL